MSVARFDRYGPQEDPRQVPDERPALMPDELEASRKRIEELVKASGFATKRAAPINSNSEEW